MHNRQTIPNGSSVSSPISEEKSKPDATLALLQSVDERQDGTQHGGKYLSANTLPQVKHLIGIIIA